MTRTDRALTNCDWLDMYPIATVSLLPWIDSDHRWYTMDLTTLYAKIVFGNKRDHIIRVIYAAAMYIKIWIEASTQNESVLQRVSRPTPTTIHDVQPNQTQLYCIVDASWKSEFGEIGIRWSLFRTKALEDSKGVLQCMSLTLLS